MDLATVIGAAVGSLLVVGVMLASGSLIMYWDLMSLVIVVGGAIASTVMRWPMSAMGQAVKAGMTTIKSDVDPPEEIVEKVIELATMARKESILALQKVTLENELMAKAVRLAVDGTDAPTLKTIVAADIAAQVQVLADRKAFYDDLSEASPAFGMIGTVIGLIVIMANLNDPSKIGPGLAVALVTTLYGSLIANMVFIPVGKKLKLRMTETMRNNEIIKIGVIGILEGTNPNMLREQLEGYIK